MGTAQDVPVPADYDGDAKSDIAVYRDGTWFILRSSDGAWTSVGDGEGCRRTYRLSEYVIQQAASEVQFG